MARYVNSNGIEIITESELGGDWTLVEEKMAKESSKAKGKKDKDTDQ